MWVSHFIFDHVCDRAVNTAADERMFHFRGVPWYRLLQDGRQRDEHVRSNNKPMKTGIGRERLGNKDRCDASTRGDGRQSTHERLELLKKWATRFTF